MQNGIRAEKTKTTFQMECAVSADIKATAGEVWQLLTNAENYQNWNSTLSSIEGDISLGGTVKMQVPEVPGRTFKVKVAEFQPEKMMVWKDGFAPMFQGIRTYNLTEQPDGSTKFTMKEVFSGLMLPMIAGSLPDFGPIFERYASDLKTAAEN